MGKKILLKAANFALLMMALPTFYGCNGGAASQLGNLFGSGGSSVAADLSGGGGLLASSGGEVHTITNPEPATMLLMGSGFMAMAFFKNKLSK